MTSIIQTICNFIEEGKEFVTATVVEAVGSSPARSGFKMIITKDEFQGSVGGGKIEYIAVETARDQIKKRKNLLAEYNLGEIGMTCGGTVKIFYEYMPGGRNFFIFGGGHVCQAVSPIAASLGFKVIVMDNRPEVANEECQKHAHTVICGDFVTEIEKLKIPDNSYALIVTNKHTHDGEVLHALCKKSEKFTYIGMIGSRTKVGLCFQQLREAGVSEETISKIYTPVGLNIGGESPAEIAVGIMAEVIAVDYNRDVPNMKKLAKL